MSHQDLVEFVKEAKEQLVDHEAFIAKQTSIVKEAIRNAKHENNHVDDNMWKFGVSFLIDTLLLSRFEDAGIRIWLLSNKDSDPKTFFYGMKFLK